jgi:hypothetical protein
MIGKEKKGRAKLVCRLSQTKLGSVGIWSKVAKAGSSATGSKENGIVNHQFVLWCSELGNPLTVMMVAIREFV